MKKHIIVAAVFSLAASFGILTPMTANASEGWVNEGDDWKYVDNSGNELQSKWKTSGDSRYYLDENGFMLKNSLLEINDNLYYFDGEGKMVKNQWRNLTVEDETSWFYFGSNGKAFRRIENGFKKTIDGKFYGFDERGRMLTGWLDESGNVVDKEGDSFVTGIYYCGSDGAMYQNQWMRSLEVPDTSLKSSLLDTTYFDYSDIWFYFDQNGKKVKGDETKIKQRDIDGKSYGFDENGVMLTWWGNPATGNDAAKYYSGYDGGALFKNQWFWMYPSESLNAQDYEDGECSWWRTDSKGNTVKDGIKLINGEWYAFDKIGRMQTSFVLSDGKSNFVAQYELNELSSKEFIKKEIPGMDRSDLYFFSSNELNEGQMQKNREIVLELDDGVFTFGFGKSGKAYGSRNELQKVKDRFYINGLRLDADSDYTYGVVKFDDRYELVDTSGKAVKGKKVLKDTDGGWYIVINGEFKAYVTDQEKPRWYDGPDGPGYYHYDSHKADKYERGIIAGEDDSADVDSLWDGVKLNFED